MTQTSEFLSVSITFDDEAEARKLAVALVEERLAACVQIHPILSVYRWEGAVEQDDELIITAKTTTARFEALRTMIRSRHSYDVPEIIGTPITEIDPDYAAWLRKMTTEG